MIIKLLSLRKTLYQLFHIRTLPDINLKLNHKMKQLFLALTCLISSIYFGQVNVRDTFETCISKYNTGLISFSELESELSTFFGSLPSDNPLTHYEKVFKRNIYFMEDRIYINELGE